MRNSQGQNEELTRTKWRTHKDKMRNSQGQNEELTRTK